MNPAWNSKSPSVITTATRQVWAGLATCLVWTDNRRLDRTMCWARPDYVSRIDIAIIIVISVAITIILFTSEAIFASWFYATRGPFSSVLFAPSQGRSSTSCAACRLPDGRYDSSSAHGRIEQKQRQDRTGGGENLPRHHIVLHIYGKEMHSCLTKLTC